VVSCAKLKNRIGYVIALAMFSVFSYMAYFYSTSQSSEPELMGGAGPEIYVPDVADVEFAKWSE